MESKKTDLIVRNVEADLRKRIRIISIEKGITMAKALSLIVNHYMETANK